MRGRGRSTKIPNILSKNFESNGPDIKIRGTAQHIAEKYVQLARDANAAGDPVVAENYYQHAEHYLRIIASAQESLRSLAASQSLEHHQDEDGDEAYSGQDSVEEEADGSSHQLENSSSEPDQEVHSHYERSSSRRYDSSDRPERNSRSGRGEKGERRSHYLRRDRHISNDSERRPQRRPSYRDRNNDYQEANANAEETTSSLPAFLTTPIRTTPVIGEVEYVAPVVETSSPQSVTEEEAKPAAKPRRRRVARVAVSEAMSEPDDALTK